MEEQPRWHFLPPLYCVVPCPCFCLQESPGFGGGLQEVTEPVRVCISSGMTASFQNIHFMRILQIAKKATETAGRKPQEGLEKLIK